MRGIIIDPELPADEDAAPNDGEPVDDRSAAVGADKYATFPGVREKPVLPLAMLL